MKTLWKLFQVWRLECSLYTHHRAGVLSEIYLFIFTFISWSFTEIAEWIFVTGALSGWSRKWGSFRKIIKVEKKNVENWGWGVQKGSIFHTFSKICRIFSKPLPHPLGHTLKSWVRNIFKGKICIFFFQSYSEARSSKVLGCIFPHRQPLVWNFPHFFFPVGSFKPSGASQCSGSLSF